MDQIISDLSFDFSKIYSDKGLILATSGAVIAAAAFRIAESLKQNTCYFSVKKNNWGYLSGFVLVGAICFYLFKFNQFQGSMVVQDPQEVIKNTPISWFGIGGVTMGISYSLSLQYSILYKISSWLDAMRIVLFIVTAKLVHGLIQPYAETESLSYIYEIDYKTYNMVILVLSGIVALFCFGKKLFLGVILGSGIIYSKALFKDKLFSLYFLAFVATFNIVSFISSPKNFKQATGVKGNKDKKLSPSKTQDEQDNKTTLDDGNKNNKSTASSGDKVTETTSKEKDNTSNNISADNIQENDKKINPKTSERSSKSSSKNINKSTKPQRTPIQSPKPVKNQQSSDDTLPGNLTVWRIIIGSVLGGVGYGICGTVPETALLDFAVFTPHVTLVYIVSFIVGFTMLSAILVIIEFDAQESVEELIQDELIAQELLEKEARKSIIL